MSAVVKRVVKAYLRRSVTLLKPSVTLLKTLLMTIVETIEVARKPRDHYYCGCCTTVVPPLV
jgi:hypothetical protein